MKKNFMLLFILIICISSFGSSVFADSSSVLTLDECIARATAYTNKINEIDRSLKIMDEQNSEILKARLNVQKDLDFYLSTTRYEETTQYKRYIFNNYIKNRDYPYYSMWVSIENTKTNKELVKKSIEAGVLQTYYQILNLQDALMQQKDSYELMKKQNGQLEEKYKAGQISESDKYLQDIAVKQQELEVIKLQRTKENLEMSLKQQTGLPLTQEISLEPLDVDGKTFPAEESYGAYLSNAIKNRAEIKIAWMELKDKKWQLDVMKEYIKDENQQQRKDAQAAADQRTVAYRNAEEKVKKNIFNGYKDMINKSENIEICQKKKDNAEWKNRNTQLMYDNGLVSLSTLWETESEKTLAGINYIRAERDYKHALYKMKLASGIGPGYYY